MVGVAIDIVKVVKPEIILRYSDGTTKICTVFDKIHGARHLGERPIDAMWINFPDGFDIFDEKFRRWVSEDVVSCIHPKVESSKIMVNLFYGP